MTTDVLASLRRIEMESQAVCLAFFLLAAHGDNPELDKN
jgi:hypothetical protein